MEQSKSLRAIIIKILESQTSDWHTIVTRGVSSGPSYRDKFLFNNPYDRQENVLHHDEHSYISVYVLNVSITLAWGLTLIKQFDASWATGFSDNSVTSHLVDVFYNNALIFREKFFSVDGGRAYLPVPKASNELYVPKNKIRFVRLIDGICGRVSDFDLYFLRAGFIETDEEWPLL